MTTKHTPRPPLHLLLSWAVFALGAIHAIAIWAGYAYLIPFEFLMLAGGLMGATGVLILGIVVWVFWGLVGLVLGMLAEGGVRA